MWIKYKHLLWICLSGCLVYSCDRYNPVNDKIYPIPELSALFSESSLDLLDNARKNDPNNPEILYKIALFFHKKKEDSIALSPINRAVRLDSTQEKFFFLQARIYYSLDSLDRALSAVRQINTRENESLETLLLTGELYFLKKDYDNAIRFFNRALQLARFESRAYYWKGRIAAVRFDSTNALQNYRFALRLRPDYVEVYNSLSELYFRYEMYNTSIKFANRGLQYQPNHDLLNFNKAEAYRMKLYADDSAKVFYEKAYLANPRLYQASYRLGRYAFDKAFYKESLTYFESALKHNPDYAYAWFYIGLIYQGQYKYEKSLEAYDKCIKLDPKNLEARDRYWYVRNKLLQERMLAKEDSIRRAYYEKLKQQREKMLEQNKE